MYRTLEDSSAELQELPVEQMRRVFDDNLGIFFLLFLYKNIHCGFSLESEN